MVQTGFQYNAGTKSKVHFILSGEDDETEVRTFTDDQREIFKRGALNMFVMSVPRCLGQLNYLRIWHDNSGKGSSASWYLKYVVVKDIHTGLKYEFIADRWFAVEEGNGMIDHLIPVAGKEQTTEFSHLFSNASRRNLTDNHIWLSVFTRPARSRFTRVQRLSCCLALLYLSMLTSAMWYQTTPEQPSPGAFKFGPLSLSPEQIGVGIMSNLIIFPPSFLMVFFFRKSRARSLRPSHVNVALENQYERWRKNYGTLNQTEETSKSQKKQQRKVDEEAQLRSPSKKKRFLLPWWCIYISWLLVVASVGCSIFFLWAYGLQFGNVRTTKWLTSLLICFISSILLTEPIKIFCLAVLMACLCGNPDVDDDDADDDEEDPYLKKDEEWLHDVNPGISVQRPKYRPIDLQALEAARKIREKEIRMHKLLKEITAYALYLWILMILSYGNRDPNSFYLRETVINNFIKPGDLWHDFNEVTTEVKFWNWTRNALLPELFAGLWYNGRKPLGLRLLLDDRNNFKIGYPVLRQVRARKDSCSVPWQMESVVSECAGYGGLINEQSGFYEKQWHSNITMESKVPPEYKYMTASELNGFPFWGQLDWYGGGGFIVRLDAKRYEDGEKLITKMLELEKTSWINSDTRAVFVEFGTYNAQVNLFVVSTIVAEFLPGGGIVPYYHIDPIKLLHYHTGAGLLQLGCQIGFLFFTAYYTVYELSASCKQGKSYFTEYWNIAELANLCAAYAAISVEIYKMIITWRILERFTATEGTGYIKLQEALILDETFCYLIGFLMSLATLKFLKLLRFNKRIGSMIATLRLCARELKGYGVCLLITFFAFVALFWLILGHAVLEFCTFLAAFESSISMMLKKFNYEDMEAASPILAPLAFFTFALTASVILVNILLTIIIQSFEEVKYDVKLQNNDYELVPFIFGRMKLFLGIQKNQNKVLPVGLKEVEKKTNVMDSFNGKVDLLLNFINSVYLDEQMDVEFLKKSKVQFSSVSDTKPEKKKCRPKRIPKHKSLIMKKHLDF
ncbi:polycystic kidney disease protein 1-like 2 [Stegodyphus dumicola]|uniref:polycystic kidney disease protein 1-like 2 n=1 Tax=Stegodyphus dumicola TaxID=202533 RepID=UPI0015AE00B9|nr:polycystic kidney disease protein 1-like 2 [Stegodyphus dumicola]